MNLNRAFFLGATLSFLGLLALAEVLLRAALATGLWYERFDPAGDLTSASELEDRVDHAARRGKAGRDPLLVVFGDSVLGPTALLEHREPRPRPKTLHHHLKAGLSSKGKGLLDLGSDGLLVPDMEGLGTLAKVLPPGEVLLLLNYRMFAEEFSVGPKALSRKFLGPWLSPETLGQVTSSTGTPLETRLGDGINEALCRHWALFKEAQALKARWFAPSRKDFFQRGLEKVTVRDEAQADIQEAALKRKIAPWYRERSWRTEALPFKSLERSLEGFVSTGSLVTVVLTPQNREFLGTSWDRGSFQRNRETLKGILKAYSKRGVRYRDWADRYPSELFLDHCHLTPEGNQRYADDLIGLLSEGKP